MSERYRSPWRGATAKLDVGMASFVITNARVVDGETVTEGDVLIQHDRIARVDGRIPIPGAAAVIDANGRYLIPGMIDAQVHFREPGPGLSGEMATESGAAVAGGVTTYFDMPNADPPTTTREQLAAKYARAAEVSRANFGFYLGADPDRLDEAAALEAGEACGIAVNLGGTGGTPIFADDAALEALMARAPMLVAIHGEDQALVDAAEAEARARLGGGVSPEFHPEIRTVEGCVAATRRAVSAGRAHGVPTHILAVSTAEELELFEPGVPATASITAGVGVPHLVFSERDHARLGMLLKCNPAVRADVNRASLLEAVRDDRVQIISTDHAPHLREDKERLYFEAPAGVPMVQDALIALLEQVQRGALRITDVVQKTAHAPAERFSVRGRGYVREGYFADLVLVDLDRETERGHDDTFSRCGWSPFEGQVLRARVASTWVNGALAFDGRRVIDVRAGRRVEHAPL